MTVIYDYYDPLRERRSPSFLGLMVTSCLTVFLLLAHVRAQRCVYASSVISTQNQQDPSTAIISHTVAVHDEKTHEQVGMIRYHYDSTVASCSVVIILGVGTFMSTGDYNTISRFIVTNQPIVMVVSDHNYGGIQKTSFQKYARHINQIKRQLGDLISICNNNPNQGHSAPNFVLGGHSASGQALLKASQQGAFAFEPIGLLGLDPYQISNATMDYQDHTLALPGLYWGFTRTTCRVIKEQAAEAAYDLTAQENRVLYQIHNPNAQQDNILTHCVSTDGQKCGIGPIECGGGRDRKGHNDDWVYEGVAQSVHVFIMAIQEERTFSRQLFQHGQTMLNRKVSLFVNHDKVMDAQYPNVVETD